MVSGNPTSTSIPRGDRLSTDPPVLGRHNYNARSERFKISKLLFSTKMQVGTSLVHHALKMNTYISILGQLGFIMDHELSIDLILSSLTNNFAQFVLNYHM